MNTSAIGQEKIEGTLAEWPLEEIIESLAATSKTGLFRTQGSEVWFDNGGIYLVQTPSSDKLSEVLFNADVGPLTEIDDRFYSPEGDGTVIDQLIEAYPDSLTQLKLVLNEYNLAGLLELLVPSDNDFEIKPGKTHRLGATLATDANKFVEQSKHRLQVWKSIATAVPSTNAVFVLNTNLPEGSAKRSFTADEWKFLSRLNGQTTVEDLIHETQDSAFRVCSSLYRLMLEGVVEEKS